MSDMVPFEFSNKAALLDTNILKEMSARTRRSETFKPLFAFMKENNITPFILDVTKFEFVGYSSNKTDYETSRKWVDSLWSHPLGRPDIEQATKLSAMYKCKNPSINPRQISFIDCLHAAYLLKFGSRAMLVTADVNDYPAFLFDMAHNIPIEEEGGSTSFVVFKVNNQDKLMELESGFEKSDRERV